MINNLLLFLKGSLIMLGIVVVRSLIAVTIRNAITGSDKQ